MLLLESLSGCQLDQRFNMLGLSLAFLYLLIVQALVVLHLFPDIIFMLVERKLRCERKVELTAYVLIVGSILL